MNDVKACPFCGESLVKNWGRERGGESYIYYDHPYNGCVLEDISVEDYEIPKWNHRVSVEIDEKEEA